MKVEKCIKSSFTVIGKEGSTNDGNEFIQNLWENANSNFNEIEHLAKKNENGKLCGVWGAMSDFSRSFNPWENNFSQGLYLAGLECVDDAEAPRGWTKWVVPSYEYIYVECDSLLLAERIFKRYAELVKLVRKLGDVNIAHTEVVNYINHGNRPFGYLKHYSYFTDFKLFWNYVLNCHLKRLTSRQ